MQWKTKDGRLMNVSEMTDNHIRNAWAYVFRQLDFGIDNDRMNIFTGFKNELRKRGKWNLKLKLQYDGLEMRNKVYHVAKEIMIQNPDYNDYEFF